MSDKFRDTNIVRKPITIASPLPEYWFGDELTIGFNYQPKLALLSRVTGIGYCHDKSEWLYCFELGEYPWSGIIWFTEWEVTDFQSRYQVEPVPSGYPEPASADDKDDGWDKIPF